MGRKLGEPQVSPERSGYVHVKIDIRTALAADRLGSGIWPTGTVLAAALAAYKPDAKQLAEDLLHASASISRDMKQMESGSIDLTKPEPEPGDSEIKSAWDEIETLACNDHLRPNLDAQGA